MTNTPDYQTIPTRVLRSKRLALRIAGLLLCTIVAAALVLNLIARHQPIAPGTASQYWQVLLSFQGFQVDEDPVDVYYVWHGRDTHDYFKVAKANVRIRQNDEVVAHIRLLISFAIKDVWDRETYHTDLVALSGQDFGTDWDRWKEWADTTLMPATIPPNPYESLRSSRRVMEPKTHPLVIQDETERWFKIAYQREVRQFWVRSIPALLGIALCFASIFRIIMTIHRPSVFVDKQTC